MNAQSTSEQAPALDLPERITITKGVQQCEVDGVTVAPGLAITQAVGYDGEPIPRRYVVTHVPSGQAFPGSRCVVHVRKVLTLAVDSGIDWTGDIQAVKASHRFQDVADRHRQVMGSMGCDRRCLGDPPTWRVRCRTCDWEWEDGYDFAGEDPTDAVAAKRLAEEHECDPWMEIGPPNGTSWHPLYEVDDDGTIAGPVPVRGVEDVQFPEVSDG